MQLVELNGAEFVEPSETIRGMRVKFGTSIVDPEDVDLITTSQLRFLTPPTPLVTLFNVAGDIATDGSGVVDVVVEVVDVDDVVLDSSTLVDGYEYRRERLDDAVQDTPDVIVRALLTQLRRDWLPRVLVTDKQIDFVAPDAQLPYATLIGPTEVPNTSYQARAPQVIDGDVQRVGPTTRKLLARVPVVVDLVFGVEVITGLGRNGKQTGVPEASKLTKRLKTLLRDRPQVVCPDPAGGPTVSYRLVWDPNTSFVIARDSANRSALRVATGSIRIVGVDQRAGTMEGMGILDVVSVIDSIEIGTSPC